MRRLTLSALFLLAGSVACASAPAPGKGTNMQVITQEEFANTSAKNAYEVVRKLRPSYLLTRGNVTINKTEADDRNTPNVFLNDQYFGPTESLSTIPVVQIAEIRLYHAGEVPLKYGQNNMGGIIAIKTK